jgi:hypothetical protein
MAALDFPSSPTNGQLYTANGKTWIYDSVTTSWLTTGSPPRSGSAELVSTIPIGYTFSGNGNTIPTGVAGVGLTVPFDGVITSATLIADQTGSMVIDIWKDTYANYPPTVLDTITASAKPTLSNAVKAQDTTLTGWSTAFSAGDIFYFNVDSCTSIQNATLILRATKTSYNAGLGYSISNGGNVLSTGLAGTGLYIPFNCVIQGWTLLGDQSGSITLDIWKDSYANYPPTVLDTITGSAKPSITTASKNTSTTLTGWTTTINAGDVLYVNVDSVTSFTNIALSLKVAKA